ncbi:AraC family transcriptional regulator [Draconibacterium sp. IB214405]|uniref:AraC family transcriptional regulator n=1 Tax=Draconibacterium sp. IB214405 TaxID=3097352 RepID=UPI002A0F0BD3|nr:AraC family transcriptional regulator [Draconibacterium sp. IB214405]MDX8338897.1 AraC family transcriptional regulator [Draconibacterium sp. IB214405]
MTTLKTRPEKGDPSDVIQFFPRYNIQLLCCRHWWLEHWEYTELSFPYWRIYHNSRNGAKIIHNDVEHEISPDRIILIPPNTSYATRLYENEIPEEGYSLVGGPVGANSESSITSTYEALLHLFIHFNIGIPYDNISPGVFSFELTEHLQSKLKSIKNHLNHDNKFFSFHISLAIKSLIADLLTELPESNWDLISNDHRIIKCLSYIEENIADDLSNPTLAANAKMATNAFIRLFSNEIGISVQKYIRNKRIDRACILLHHSNLSIDEIAQKTGFADRYHFSRIFKQSTSISPARYKKEFGLA